MRPPLLPIADTTDGNRPISNAFTPASAAPPLGRCAERHGKDLDRHITGACSAVQPPSSPGDAPVPYARWFFVCDFAIVRRWWSDTPRTPHDAGVLGVRWQKPPLYRTPNTPIFPGGTTPRTPRDKAAW
jgi:hypothetical protein